MVAFNYLVLEVIASNSSILKMITSSTFKNACYKNASFQLVIFSTYEKKTNMKVKEI